MLSSPVAYLALILELLIGSDGKEEWNVHSGFV